MAVEPDLAGYRDAQERLRDKLGQDITFYIPNAATYADDVALDPETGEPYDPTAVPEEGGDFEEETVRCSVVRRVLAPTGDDDIEEGAGGINRTGMAAVACDAADYEAVSDATKFDLDTLTYRITDSIPDGLGQIERYVIFGEAT